MKCIIFMQILTLLVTAFLSRTEMEGDSFKTKGVLDRFEDNDLAVIIIEKWNEELIVPENELPNGSREDTWFNIEGMHGELNIISIDWQTTLEKRWRDEWAGNCRCGPF